MGLINNKETKGKKDKNAIIYAPYHMPHKTKQKPEFQKFIT